MQSCFVIFGLQVCKVKTASKHCLRGSSIVRRTKQFSYFILFLTFFIGHLSLICPRCPSMILPLLLFGRHRLHGRATLHLNPCVLGIDRREAEVRQELGPGTGGLIHPEQEAGDPGLVDAEAAFIRIGLVVSKVLVEEVLEEHERGKVAFVLSADGGLRVRGGGGEAAARDQLQGATNTSGIFFEKWKEKNGCLCVCLSNVICLRSVHHYYYCLVIKVRK